MQLCLTAEQIDAAEAHRIYPSRWFAGRRSPPRRRWRRPSRQRPAARRHALEAVPRADMPLAEGLAYEARLRPCAATPRHEGRHDGLLEKRPARFTGRYLAFAGIRPAAVARSCGR
jgi:hypothetical protein